MGFHGGMRFAAAPLGGQGEGFAGQQGQVVVFPKHGQNLFAIGAIELQAQAEGEGAAGIAQAHGGDAAIAGGAGFGA